METLDAEPGHSRLPGLGWFECASFDGIVERVCEFGSAVVSAVPTSRHLSGYDTHETSGLDVYAHACRIKTRVDGCGDTLDQQQSRRVRGRSRQRHL